VHLVNVCCCNKYNRSGAEWLGLRLEWLVVVSVAMKVKVRVTVNSNPGQMTLKVRVIRIAAV